MNNALSSLRPSDMVLLGNVMMLLFAAFVAETMGDFNTWTCLILTGIMTGFMCFTVADSDPDLREENGQRFLNRIKFFIKAAFLSALLALARSYWDNLPVMIG